jgi:hypothetical protein
MITTRQLAYLAGRKWVLSQTRKPAEKKLAEECPFEYTAPGTPEKDQKHENGARTAWLAGAREAREDYVTPSKRTVSKRHPRAQARRVFQQRAKLQAKGYILAV